jgi:cytosine/adenosine deaminase-related metal-dependent hydrolase
LLEVVGEDGGVLTIHVAPVVLPIVSEPIEVGAVAVEGDRIVDVGQRADVAGRYPTARTREWPGILAPGLVNAHAHLEYSDFADLATSGLPFPDWIRVLTGRRASFTPAMWRESTRRGIHEMLRTGTTAAADIATGADALNVTAKSALAGVTYIEVVGADDEVWRSFARSRLEGELDSAPAGRRTGVSPHTLYTLSLGAFAEATHLARTRGLRLHPHLAETSEEAEFILAGTGRFAEVAQRFGWEMELIRDGGSGGSPAKQLAALNALGPDVHVAHGVHCDEADRALLRENETYVALCPRSNRILEAGEAPIADYLAEGNPIALGTDSLASTPSLDLLEDVRAAREIAIRQGYEENDLDRRLIEAATLGGARAMGLDDVGVLKPGARADLAVFDAPTGGDHYAALTASGRCIGTVLAGTIVHRARL